MRFDPRLRVPDHVAHELAAIGVGPAMLSVVVSSSYAAPLTCEVVNGEMFVRAATGDEVTDLLTTGSFEPRDTIAWPGDTPARVGCNFDWRERAGDAIGTGSGIRLWAGEVVFRNGRGLAGPFYVHHMAAVAWAFSTVIGREPHEVFNSQVVPYACVREFAPALLLGGDAEARRLSRFEVSPLRPWDAPIPGGMSPPESTPLRG